MGSGVGLEKGDRGRGGGLAKKKQSYKKGKGGELVPERNPSHIKS